jgi:hypothetical protein
LRPRLALPRSTLMLSALWWLTACALGYRPPDIYWQDVLHLRVEDTRLHSDATGSFVLHIAVLNKARQASPPASIELTAAYITDANGRFVRCPQAWQPLTATPCLPPMTCQIALPIRVPSIAPGETWQIEQPIHSSEGACSCTQNHCDGEVWITLAAADQVNPKLNPPIRSILLTWTKDGQKTIVPSRPPQPSGPVF